MRGNQDVVFLQETHLNEKEHDIVARHFTAKWGFKYTTVDRYSFWASGKGRRAGVAILVNPYGAVRNMQSWRSDAWSEHLVMTTGKLAGRRVLFINIYAPSNGAARILFFNRLLNSELPADAEVICGGDFNCVLKESVDRLGASRTRNLGVRELQRFMDKTGIIDPADYLQDGINGEDGVRNSETEDDPRLQTADQAPQGQPAEVPARRGRGVKEDGTPRSAPPSTGGETDAHATCAGG
ncbi:unnamed protein product [Phytophthora fragariaefolia]|uniref:Unnamed protein product n=1 Tax=Phytophthora fragariaefolia TaxID=1490495 RepID=A0A9W6YHM4_9STRA|nr:unnamed protein product [Phytophthora fragariaefolia]